MSRHVLLTRPAARCAALAARLESEGLRVTVAPAIRIVTLESGVEAAGAAMAGADRVLLTSANAVRALDVVADPPPAWCVGGATAEAATAAGFAVERAGASGLGELVGAVAATEGLAGLSVLWPCGNLSDDGDVARWREAGAAVLSIPVYATGSGYQDVAAPDAADVDDVVFASPSAVLFLLEALGETRAPALLSGARAVAIGATTEAALVAAGWREITRAASPDDEGLYAALTAP